MTSDVGSSNLPDNKPYIFGFYLQTAVDRQSVEMAPDTKMLTKQSASLNSSMRRKSLPWLFIKTCWMFTETKQWMWIQIRGRERVSTVMTDVCHKTCLRQLYTADHMEKILLYGWKVASFNTIIVNLVFVVCLEINFRQNETYLYESPERPLPAFH